MISVIIPHLNDPGLEACLDSLAAQTGFDGAWEILVVDNGSTTPPEALCHRHQNVRLLHEPIPGPGPARNLGVAHANGEILAFTDSDCTVAPNWLAEIAIGMADPSTQVLGGAVDVAYVNPQTPTFTEPYERVYAFRNQDHIAQGYSASANLAMRAEVFPAVGGFGGREIAEDQDWGLRATAMGFRPIYRSSMVVQNAPRADFAAVKRKWGRHIAHDFNAGPNRLIWAVRAVAVMVSPALEIGTVMGTDKLSGLHERALCFACLCRVRVYRGWKMLAVMIRGHADINWNAPDV